MSTLQVRRQTGWRHDPRIRRLGGWLFGGLLLALMTGRVQGTNTDYTLAFRAALLRPRVLLFLVLAVAAWALVEYGGPVRARVREELAPVLGLRARLLEDHRARRVEILAVLVLLVAVPAFLSPFWQRVLVDQIGIFVLLAIGLNVVVGWAGLLDLGYVAFFAIGAYTAAYWTGALPVKPPIDLNPFLVLPLAVLTCLVAGLLLGAPTLRLRGDYLAIVTLGFHEIVRIVAVNSDPLTNGPRGAFGIPHFSVNLFGLQYKWTLSSLPYWYLLLAFTVLIVVAFNRLDNSRIGRAWMAIREDEVAAAASGVPTVRFKLLAFAIGASTSGFAGVIYSAKVGFINPDNFPLLLSILVLAYVIFGGMGSLPGVIIGAALLGWLPQFLRDYVDPQDRFMYVGALLVIMMIYRPQGVLPSRRRSRELGLAEAGVGEADALSTPAEGKIS
ncbi:MAG: branched-chain amino acid ABC transporter permease [Actinomycetota bacterium]